MPEQPFYKSLEIYNLSKKLVVACYELTHEMPAEEGTHFSKYIRTAALNCHLNVAQGAFLKNKKKKKFVREAQNALVVIDAAVEILVEVHFATPEQVEKVLHLSSLLYQMLDAL